MKTKVTTFKEYINYIRNNKNTPEEHSMMDNQETLENDFNKYLKKDFIFVHDDSSGKVTKEDKK